MSRNLARLFRAVLKASLEPPRNHPPLVLAQTSSEGLVLQAQHGDVGLRYHDTKPRDTARLGFPSSLLDEIQGRSDEPVTLEAGEPGKGWARWIEAGVPRTVEFVADTSVALPALPEQWTTMPASFRQALAEASATTTKDSPRIGLTRVQLRGKDGEVVGTDGKQLLIRGGFRFPFSENLLIPRLRAVGLRELGPLTPLHLGRTATHLALRLGHWTFWLALDGTSRFPDVRSVVPKASAIKSRLHLHPADAAFLLRALPKLPGREDANAPVTLELDQSCTVRARGTGSAQIVELALSRSKISGDSVRLCIHRQLLARALRIGSRELDVTRADQPLVWRQQDCVYVFQTFVPYLSLTATPDALRIDSANVEPTREPPCSSTKEETMPTQEPNGHAAHPAETQTAADGHDLTSEAMELRRLLQEAAGRASRLITALKQQRRQDRVMRAAMSSLRQLKELGLPSGG